MDELCNRRLPLVVLLLLCAAPPCVEAQQFVCSPIVPGDTASSLARRLTGNSAAAHTHVFQIRDPARQMFVPKSRYRQLSTDWQACVAIGPLKNTPVAYAPVVALAGPAIASAGRAIGSVPLTITPARRAFAPWDGSVAGAVFLTTMACAVVFVVIIVAAVSDSLLPRPIPPLMRRAGEEFVNAFAQPLIDLSPSMPPIEARLRFVRHSRQLEISIAPGAGRRYPNLIDHRMNVEYDVQRVMRVLGNHFVVSDRLRAAGRWVVVPIRLTDAKQTGAK
jgi:hypothetical protein